MSLLALNRCTIRGVAAAKRLVIDPDANDVTLQFGAREVRLTNLRKLFWKS